VLAACVPGDGNNRPAVRDESVDQNGERCDSEGGERDRRSRPVGAQAPRKSPPPRLGNCRTPTQTAPGVGHGGRIAAGGSRRSCASAVDRAHPTLEDGEGIDVVALSRMRGTETCPVGALEACMRRAKSGTARCSCGANGTAGGPARCALAAPKLRRHRMPRIPSALLPVQELSCSNRAILGIAILA
jgi:hypothetical protein